ncbi:hypothetical protein PVAND_003875 [Polypedilum vanderplanki]|uniref:G protein-activated inward rectifier potassium channel 3 n=1 Tax=Polypedilum vanderplanki TaxID=319348 RepID=A0A9J6BVY0_POLVA|nr:hypothetical protein PVAND_003875 [Polypedilum vanderplanki]
MGDLEKSDRIVFKRGKVNAVKLNVGRHYSRYFKDIFTSVVDAQWRYSLSIFACGFITSWAFFACLWYLMAYYHGDIDYYKRWMVSDDRDKFEKENPTPCVRNLYNFTSAFLFSIETQFSIGYGFRYITESCVTGPVLLVCQAVWGTLIEAFLMGFVIAKFARPKKRAQNIRFSKNAVICHRNGVPHLMFRIVDTRKSHIVQAQVRARMLSRKMTREGELINFYQQDLKLNAAEECDNYVLLMWPTIVIHRIDSSSPLYDMSPQDLKREQFEIIVMLEGGVESTGLATQARTSYKPNEILWGHRFLTITNFNEQSSEFEVDYSKFHMTYEVETPLYSAKVLDQIKEEEEYEFEKNDHEKALSIIQSSIYKNGHVKFAY